MKNETTITLEDVYTLEQEIDFTFPESYIMRVCDRGTTAFDKNTVTKNGELAKNDDGSIVSIKNFMSPIAGKKEAIRTIMCFVPKHLIPFAFEPTGQIFCFSREEQGVFIYNQVTKTYMQFTESFDEFFGNISFEQIA